MKLKVILLKFMVSAVILTRQQSMETLDRAVVMWMPLRSKIRMRHHVPMA